MLRILRTSTLLIWAVASGAAATWLYLASYARPVDPLHGRERISVKHTSTQRLTLADGNVQEVVETREQDVEQYPDKPDRLRHLADLE